MHRETPQSVKVFQHMVRALAQRLPCMLDMLQGQATVAFDIHPHNLNVRLPVSQIVLACE